MPKLPNALIFSILSIIQISINQLYPGYWWSPGVLALVVAAAKWVQTPPAKPVSTTRGLQPAGTLGTPSPEKETSRFYRWLVD